MWSCTLLKKDRRLELSKTEFVMYLFPVYVVG